MATAARMPMMMMTTKSSMSVNPASSEQGGAGSRPLFVRNMGTSGDRHLFLDRHPASLGFTAKEARAPAFARALALGACFVLLADAGADAASVAVVVEHLAGVRRGLDAVAVGVGATEGAVRLRPVVEGNEAGVRRLLVVDGVVVGARRALGLSGDRHGAGVVV